MELISHLNAQNQWIASAKKNIWWYVQQGKSNKQQETTRQIIYYDRYITGMIPNIWTQHHMTRHQNTSVQHTEHKRTSCGCIPQQQHIWINNQQSLRQLIIHQHTNIN